MDAALPAPSFGPWPLTLGFLCSVSPGRGLFPGRKPGKKSTLLKGSGGLCNGKPSGFAKQMPRIRAGGCKERPWSATRLPQCPKSPPSALTHPGGNPWAEQRGVRGPPLCGGDRRGRLSYLLCRGAEGGRCAGTRPGGNYSRGNYYSSGMESSDDATLQEWQGCLVSAPGAGLIQPCPVSRSPSPRGRSRILPAEHREWCCSGGFPSRLRTGNFCPAGSVGTLL